MVHYGIEIEENSKRNPHIRSSMTIFMVLVLKVASIGTIRQCFWSKICNFGTNFAATNDININSNLSDSDTAIVHDYSLHVLDVAVGCPCTAASRPVFIFSTVFEMFAPLIMNISNAELHFVPFFNQNFI